MKQFTVFLALVSALLMVSCAQLSGHVSEMSVEELAARVPAYDDSTPVNSWVLRDIKTIGELRAALAGGMDPNGSNERGWHMDYGSSYDAKKMYSKEELVVQRLAFLDVMLKAGGDPQKAAPVGEEAERGIAYALCLRHGLRADEPFTQAPNTVAEDGHKWERYPLNCPEKLPAGIIARLVADGAPLNERFWGKTLLMKMYAGIWDTLLAERHGRVKEGERSSAECWDKASEVTQQLISLGADLSLKCEGGYSTLVDYGGYCAIDFIPLAGEMTAEKRAAYREEDFARANELRQLLLAHGSPARRSPGTLGEVVAAITNFYMTVSWDEDAMEEEQKECDRRIEAERAAREARMAPLRAARRAAGASKPEPVNRG